LPAKIKHKIEHKMYRHHVILWHRQLLQIFSWPAASIQNSWIHSHK